MSFAKLTVKQASLIAGVCPGLIYGWIGQGSLPHYRLGLVGRRGAIRIKEDDLKAFIESLRHETKALRQVKMKPVTLKHLRLS